MSLRREATLNEVVLALAPITKREAFQSPKYSPIVGTITTSAVERVGGVGLVGRGRRQQLVGLAVELGRGRDEEGGVGQHLAELAGLAVAVEVGLDVARRERGILAPERGLGDVVERAGLLEGLAVRRLQRERDGALRVLLEARPGVDVDVVLHERGRAGDDALHALVVGVVRRASRASSSRAAASARRPAWPTARRSRSRAAAASLLYCSAFALNSVVKTTSFFDCPVRRFCRPGKPALSLGACMRSPARRGRGVQGGGARDASCECPLKSSPLSAKCCAPPRRRGA